MKWAVLVVALAACHGRDALSSDVASRAYHDDISKLCDCVHLSGADQAKGDRSTQIALWLGSNIATDEAHKFLVSIQPLEGEAKARALQAEAKRVGLDGCALAAEWRTTK